MVHRATHQQSLQFKNAFDRLVARQACDERGGIFFVVEGMVAIQGSILVFDILEAIYFCDGYVGYALYEMVVELQA